MIVEILRDPRQTMSDLTCEILSNQKYWQRYCEPKNVRLPSAHEQFVEVGGEHTVRLYIDAWSTIAECELAFIVILGNKSDVKRETDR